MSDSTKAPQQKKADPIKSAGGVQYITKASQFEQPWMVVPCSKGRVRGMVIVDAQHKTVPEDAIMERLHDLEHSLAALLEVVKAYRESCYLHSFCGNGREVCDLCKRTDQLLKEVEG
jgi:hypothetical protein